MEQQPRPIFLGGLLEEHGSTNDPRGELLGEVAAVDEVNHRDQFMREENDANVSVLARMFDIISLYQKLRGHDDIGVSAVCNPIDDLILRYRGLAFKGKDGECRVCGKPCLQISDLSPHLCSTHMGQFIQVKSQTRKASSVITQVKNLQDKEERDQQARYLIAAERHGQGADEQYYDANTPKRQNRGTGGRLKSSKFIDDEANDDDDEYSEEDNDDCSYHRGECADEANNGEGDPFLSQLHDTVLGSGIGSALEDWEEALQLSSDASARKEDNEKFIDQCQPMFHEMMQQGIPRFVNFSDQGDDETVPMAEGEEKSY